MGRHIRNLSVIFLIILAGVAFWATRPDEAQWTLDQTSGVKPKLTDPRPQNIPTARVAEAVGWAKGAAPKAPEGFTVTRFAEALDHPRNIVTLPNGDILVAETNKPAKGGSGGITGFFERYFMGKAGAGVPSANRITLLRDGDGDGVAEVKTPLITGLNSPFGIAFAKDKLYVANTDGVRWWPYTLGATKVEGEGKLLKKLNAAAPNMHWTRNLLFNADASKLYIAVGSNSNIQENGREAEDGRARIIEYDFTATKANNFAIGVRNPVGMAWNPWTGKLWATVNERDMLGSDLVPDYMSEIPEASDFGWPHHYWGGYTDDRVQPAEPETRQYERRPDYALGAHVAPLGLIFTDGLKLGGDYARGAFVARHGSWNRVPMAGYDVVYVAFNAKGEPEGLPRPFLTGFLTKDETAQGRPTMLTAAKDGALLVSDDVGGIIWRVAAKP